MGRGTGWRGVDGWVGRQPGQRPCLRRKGGGGRTLTTQRRWRWRRGDASRRLPPCPDKTCAADVVLVVLTHRAKSGEMSCRVFAGHPVSRPCLPGLGACRAGGAGGGPGSRFLVLRVPGPPLPYRQLPLPFPPSCRPTSIPPSPPLPPPPPPPQRLSPLSCRLVVPASALLGSIGRPFPAWPHPP